jgi:hypothetical protein
MTQQEKAALQAAPPAAEPAASIPAQTGISIDKSAYKVALAVWIGHLDYYQDSEHEVVKQSYAALVAHIDAYGQQQREAGRCEVLHPKGFDEEGSRMVTRLITAANDAREPAEKAEAALAAQQVEPFQACVRPWLLACFGAEIAADRTERNHRFLEEAIELVQACGCTASEAHQLVDYVFGRPVGEPAQEVGGVMVTLAALCLAHGMDMSAAGETELARIWTKVEQIRAKQAAKPKYGPLPGPAPVDQAGPCDICDDTRTAFGKRCSCAEGKK